MILLNIRFVNTNPQKKSKKAKKGRQYGGSLFSRYYYF